MDAQRNCSAVFFCSIVLMWVNLLNAGEVQDLIVTPNPGKVGQTVSFIPRGTGTCGRVELHFGDTMVKLLDNLDFSAPPIVDYQYASPGAFETMAKPASDDCSGMKAVEVDIEQESGSQPGTALWRLCNIVGCNRRVAKEKLDVPVQMAIAPPELKMALHIPPAGVSGDQTLVPGGKIRLGGEHFGSEPGRVFIYGIPGHNPLDLEILEWNKTKSQVYSNTALVRIPEGLKGPFYPINVRLILARKQGSVQDSTSELKRQFTVPGEVLLLPARYPAVRVEHCSQDANGNSCRPGHHNEEFCAIFEGVIGQANVSGWDFMGATIEGHHSNCSGTPDDDSGTDRYRVSLKNGWIIHDITGRWSGSSSNEKVILPSAGDYVRKSDVVLPVRWEVSPADEIHYIMKVYIVGPPGTRYQ